MTDFYYFQSKDADGQSLVPVLNLLLPNNAVGAEIGVYKAHTFCTLLQSCPKISTLYGIDSYKPYADFLKEPYDNIPAYIVDEKEINFVRMLAFHNIEYSGFKEKAVMMEEDTQTAVLSFEDNSLDFVFLDTYMTLEQAVLDLETWYPKVKPGGIFSGHDWNSPSSIQIAVNDFREKNKINSTMSTFDNTWMWIK